jgi:hypothetical protein
MRLDDLNDDILTAIVGLVRWPGAAYETCQRMRAAVRLMPLVKFSPLSSVTDVALSDSMPLLRWMLSHSVTRTHRTLYFLCRHGTLEAVRLAIRRRIPFSGSCLAAAITNPHDDQRVAVFAAAYHYVFASSYEYRAMRALPLLCRCMASHGYVDLLKWVDANVPEFARYGSTLQRFAWDGALANDQVDVCRWLHSVRAPGVWSHPRANELALYASDEMAAFLRSIGIKLLDPTELESEEF